MNYYARHIGDFIRDTVSLSMLEDGAYNRLLDQCYLSEKPLPTDTLMIYRMTRAQSKTDRKAVDFVLHSFFELRPEGYVQKRVTKEIGKYVEKQTKARDSAHKRWGAEHANAYANALLEEMPTQCEGNAHHHPIANKEIKPKDGSHEPVADPWEYGVDLLTREGGLSEQTARKYIGGLCKQWAKETVLSALMAASGKADPKAYAMKWLQSKPKESEKTAGVVFKHGQATIGGFVP